MRCGGLLAMGLALVSVLSPVLARADVVLSASDTSQALIRPAFRASAQVPGQPARSDGLALDLITAPQASLTFDGRQTDLQFSYSPSFTWRDALSPDPLERNFLLLNAGLVSFTYAPIGARWRLTLTQTGSIGERNFATLTPLTPADPNVRPDPSVPRVSILPSVQQQTVSIAAAQSSASLAYRWSSRWGSTLTAAYGLSGGWGEASAAILPRQQTESGNVSVDYQATRNDTLSTTGGASHTLITNGYEYWFAQVGETWTRGLGKDLSLAVTGGLVQIWTRCRPQSICLAQNPGLDRYTTSVRPLVSATLRGAIYLLKRRDYTLSLLLGTGLTPVLNPLTGQLQTRAQGSSTLLLTMKRTTVAATLDALQTIPPDDADAVRVIGAGLLAAHRPVKPIELSIGYRSVWQFSQSAAFDVPRQWAAFAAITVSAPPLKF